MTSRRSYKVGDRVLAPFGGGRARGQVTELKNHRVYVSLRLEGADDFLRSAYRADELELA